MGKFSALEVLEERGLSEELEKLLDVISLCRDINNDFPKRDFEKEFKEIEDVALLTFKQIFFKQENRERINVVVIGNFSSGKSSLINCIFGKELCPTKANPTTSSITRFVYGEKERIFLIKENGEKREISHRDYLKLSQHHLESMEKTKSYFFEYQYPSEILESIVLYDTPGFENPKNKFDEELTKELFLEKADVVIFVQDISKPSLEEKTLKRIKELQSLKKGLPWILVLNKADIISKLEFEKVKNYWNSQETKDLFEEIIIYSAKEVIELYGKEKTLKETKDEIFKQLLTEKELLLVIDESEEKVLFKKKATQGRRLKLIAETNNKKLKFEIETWGEKVEILKTNHEKLLSKLKELALRKDKLLSKRINELKEQLIKKAEENLKKVDMGLKPELFEPVESYRKVLLLLRNSKEKHLRACISKEFSSSELKFILEDVQLYVEELFKREKISLELFNSTVRLFNKESEEKVSVEELKRLYDYLINSLEREINVLISRAENHTKEVRKKLRSLRTIITELKKEHKAFSSRKVKPHKARRKRC